MPDISLIAEATWPLGFVCEHCAGRDWYTDGMSVVCVSCRTAYNMDTKKVRILLRSPSVVQIVWEVCTMFGVPLEKLLLGGRQTAVIRARHCAAKMVNVYLVESEMCELGLQSCLKIAPPTAELWKKALAEREKKRKDYERRHNRYLKRKSGVR
jgi:hypothetical protein